MNDRMPKGRRSGCWDKNLTKTNRAAREREVLYYFDTCPGAGWVDTPRIADGGLIPHASGLKVITLVKKMHAAGLLQRKIAYKSHNHSSVYAYRKGRDDVSIG